MGKFIDQCNLILESIISQARKERIQLPITLESILYYFKQEKLSPEDSKYKKLQQILSLFPMDPAFFSKKITTLEGFLGEFETRLQKRDRDLTVEQIPQLEKYKELQNGVTLYRTKLKNINNAGHFLAKICEKFWGDNHWSVWYVQYFNETVHFPPILAFQGNKYLGHSYMKNGIGELIWKSIMGLQHNNQIVLSNGVPMKIEETDEERIAYTNSILGQISGIKYNQQTKLYDVDGDVRVRSSMIQNGKLIVKFGVVTGDFKCNEEIVTCEGFPTKVRNLYIYNIKYLKSLQGCPQEVEGDFICKECKNLTNLIGAPRKVGGDCIISYNYGLKDLQGCPQQIGGTLNCTWNYRMSSLKGGPRVVPGDLILEKSGITSLQGAPIRVGGLINMSNCQKCSLEQRRNYRKMMEKLSGKKKITESVNKHLRRQIIKQSPPWDWDEDDPDGSKAVYEKAKQQFINKFNLKYNQQTKRWDCDGDIIIGDSGGHWSSLEILPVPLGVVKGKFECNNKFVKGDYFPTSVGGKDLNQENIKNIIERNNLVFNKETQSWDAPGDVDIKKQDLAHCHGHLPIKFGVVNGDFRFECGMYENLTSLQNSPRIVKGIFYFGCSDVKNMVGGPEEVDGDIWPTNKLESFEGAPRIIGGSIHSESNYELKSLEGLPEVVGGKLWFSWCHNLKSLKGAPQKCQAAMLGGTGIPKSEINRYYRWIRGGNVGVRRRQQRFIPKV